MSQVPRQFSFVETCILKCTVCSVETWRKDSCVFQVYVLKRPHVDEFLKRMGELFECVLFTASLAKVRNISKPEKYLHIYIEQDYKQFSILSPEKSEVQHK